MYYTYMLRCEDNSIYTGITTDVKRRMKEHFERGEKCAKYTLKHHAKKLEAVWESENRVLSSKLEYRIKRLSKIEKENLIKTPNKFNIYFKDTLTIDEYKYIDIKNLDKERKK